MTKLNFEGRVAIITGAGGGLGRAYALLLGSLGCSVVVNDLGGSRSGEGASHRAADLVVSEIVKNGGKAIPNYDSVEEGEKIVEQALKKFGRVDILINNAGILRDKSFSKMTDNDWDLVYKVHVRGAFKVTKAAWEVFQRQKYGRIIMTTSAAGLYGNYGQTNYGSAKLALVGFGETLAKEGAKKNIFCNIIAPVAGSRITETVLPPNLIEKLRPEYVAPFVAFLCHESSNENGSIYEVGAGFAAKVRWERSSGALLKVDDNSFTPAAIKDKLKESMNFSKPQYPTSMSEVDWVGLLNKSHQLSTNSQGSPLKFDNRVVLITGAGGGLGRAYALMFGSLGAKVVVNDLGRNKEGQKFADIVVEEIRQKGGEAYANYDSVENGDAIVNNVINKYQKIDVIINNAGILRDKSFAKLTEEEWDLILSIHLRGTYKVIKAAWPHMLKQGYGRIVNTSSAVGLYGNFGQANYSCAKAGILGLSNSLAAEGKKYNILVNTIAPNAGTRMTATILPSDVVNILKPDYVAPLVGFLAHESNNLSGTAFEVGSGWFSQVRWQRNEGFKLETIDNRAITIENVASNWEKFNSFTGKVYYPQNAQESFSSIIQFIDSSKGGKSSNKESKEIFEYGKRDIMLYNLGVGCSERELKYVYEGDASFSAIPTFGVIPAFVIMMSANMNDYVDGYNPSMLLHGEHYLEVLRPIPVEGKLKSKSHVLQVLPKGKGCVVVIQIQTFNSKNELVTINEGTIFLRGATPKKAIDDGSQRRALSIESPTIPNRKPDQTITQKIPENQAAIYRLSGDYNPLHIDNSFAQMGGFSKPILHGLCSYGHAAQHVLKCFGEDNPSRFKAIKARFTKHVFPGETIQTEMWKISPTRVVFQVRVLERNEIIIGNAFVELQESVPQSTGSSSNGVSKSKTLFVQYSKVYESLPLAMREDQVKKVNGVFQFEIKDLDKTYYIDLKSGSGKIGEGKVTRPDITIIVKDEDFGDLASGKINGQQAFMKGKVQIKGDMMLAMKLDRVLKTLSTKMSSKI